MIASPQVNALAYTTLSRSTNPEKRTTPEYVRNTRELITLRSEYKSIVYSSVIPWRSGTAPTRCSAQCTNAVEKNTITVSASTTHQ